MSEILTVQDLVKSYDKRVLNGVQMTVERGSVHGLIGENGAGKTTLLKCIMGIYEPEQGTIRYKGESIYENPETKAHIGYVADQCVYFPKYRLQDILKIYQKMYQGFLLEKFQEVNALISLDIKRKRVQELSKGQKMIFSLALNIAAGVDLLIMDEATSGIDAIIKKKLYDFLIHEVEQRELTILLSSHHLLELGNLCDRISVLKGGRISGEDTVEEITGKVQKVNFIFPDGAPEKFLQEKKLISYSNVGSIYTVLFRELADTELEQIIEKYHPRQIEILQTTLEEMFVYTEGGTLHGEEN